MPLFARSETKFFTKVVDAEIEFGEDDKGAVAYLVLHQGGRDTKAPRTSDKVAEHKEIAVSAPDPDTIHRHLRIAAGVRPGHHAGRRPVGLAGYPAGKIPLFAESETKFFPKVMDAEIEFLKDDKGAVTHLVVHQGPAEIKAPWK